MFFGLQYYLNYLTNPITHQDVDEFLDDMRCIMGTVSPQMETRMRELANYGKWPLFIKAIKEGTMIEPQNAVLSMVNTRPEFYWVPGFVESLLLKTWYSSVVATASYEYRKTLEQYLYETTNDYNENKKFMVHDFGYRSDSSEESAVISGMAHLMVFKGSDTIPAHAGLIKYYGANKLNTMKSVPASEHSVMCSFGKTNEIEAFKHMLRTYPTGVVSIVSDTYNIWNVMTNFVTELKPDILARGPGSKVVFRPDSGNPEHIICGDPDAPLHTPENLGCIRLLDQAFGSTKNEKGYKVLNPAVGLIYGDGMYLERYAKILERLKLMGYATSNLVIGVGSLLRYYSRDTLGYALKASNVTIDSVDYPIQKNPITDQSKKSHIGLLKVVHQDGRFQTVSNVDREGETEGFLVPVFKDGEIIKKYTMDEIRDHVYSQMHRHIWNQNFGDMCKKNYKTFDTPTNSPW